MNDRNRDTVPVDSKDRPWIEAARRELELAPMSPDERARFRQRLEARMVEPRLVPMRTPSLALAGIALAVLIWFLVPETPELAPEPNELIAVEQADSASLLAYTYYETDYFAADSEEPAGFPDDYLAIASAFEIR